MGNFLQGVRVIALTQQWAGPWAGAVLADMGAEVIKVESNQRLDAMRVNAPFVEGKPGVNRSVNFNTLNRGQKSCTINLKRSNGVEILKKLVKISDIVIENFSPRVMPSLGLDYNTLREVKPDIIMVQLPGFGSTGPEKNYVSQASTVGAVGGLLHSFGYPGGEPVLPGIHIGDPVGAMWGVVCILGALNFRHKTGRGQHIDLAQTEALITLIPEVIMEYIMNRRIRSRMGNRDEIMAPHNCYRCKGDDKWVAIVVSTDEEWGNLCRAMGNPEWCKDERFSDQFSRWHNQDELDRLITEWTVNYTHYEVMHRLQDVGVAAGPSLNAEELLNDPHIKERGAIIEQNHSESGKNLVYRSPWASALTKDITPAPCLGEHNSYVFNELLGMSDKELDQLVDEKVIY